MIHRLVLPGFAVLVVLLAGCATGGTPTLDVKGFAVSDRSDEAVALDVLVDVGNLTVEPIDLVVFNYRVAVDGQNVFAAEWNALNTAPAGRFQVVELPAIIRYEDVEWSPAAPLPTSRMTVNGSLTYLKPGTLTEILFDTGVRRPKVSFAFDGEVDLEGGLQ